MPTTRCSIGVFVYCVGLVLSTTRLAAEEMNLAEFEGVLLPPGLVDLGRRLPPAAPPWDGAPALPATWPSPPALPPEEGKPRVRLSWSDPTGVAAMCGAAAQEEVVRVFASAGIGVVWQEAQETLQPGEIRVIVLDRAAGNRKDPVLGATPNGFERAPYLWVHLPSVLSVLGLGGRNAGSLDGLARRNLAVAVGRVVAHEIVHALAPSVPHSAGLMSARLRVRELTAPTISVPVRVGAQLVAVLANEARALAAADAARRTGPQS